MGIKKKLKGEIRKHKRTKRALKKIISITSNLHHHSAHHLLRGYAFLPNSITFTVTYKCNLRCRMCPIYGESGNFNAALIRDELTLSEIVNLIDDINPSLRGFYLTGGEPFIRKDIFEIIKAIKSRGMSCAINTNATLITEEKAKKIVEHDVDDVVISIDGPEKVHNFIRGMGNAFELSRKGIEYLLSERGNREKPRIGMNCVISKSNLAHLEEVFELAEELGVDNIQFQHVSFLDQARVNAHQNIFKNRLNDPCPAVSGFLNESHDIDVALLIEKIESIRELSKKSKLNIGFTPDLSDEEAIKWYSDLSYVRSTKCIYPWKTARLQPNGQIALCFRYEGGSIKERSFKEVWNNERMKLFRRELKKEGIFPGCARCCQL